jgi:hypothetical protein
MTTTKSANCVTVVLFLLVCLSACRGSDTTTPTGPTTLPVPPAAPAPPFPGAGPGQGTITIRELNPAAGATLAVRNDCPAGRGTRVCTDQWRGTFDVTVDREMTNAVLTVSFYDGQTICGYGASTMDIVPLGQRVSFNVVGISLSDEFGTFAAPCPLPATTNRIQVELWSDFSSWTNTLIREFEDGYTFSQR